MSDRPSNAVFISYRRDASRWLAMALYQHLIEHQVDTFYDIESIRAGQFDTIILDQIGARPYFLLVLTPGTLERCHEPEDWLRREIEQAVSTRRVIVPVHSSNFDFGDVGRFIPEHLGEELQRFNRLELPDKWFKVAVQQLVEEYLVPIDAAQGAVSIGDQAVVDQMLLVAQAAPTVTSVQLSAHDYFERAFARSSEDVDAAIADYDEAIRLNPHFAEAFNCRGIARGTKGDLGGGLADWDEAIRLNPRYANAFYNRGVAHKVNGDVDAAIADYDLAIRLNPHDADTFLNRGVAREEKGDLDGGFADYDEAIRLNPRYTEAFLNRGVARTDKGDLEGAIADYDEAIRLNPRYANAFINRGVARTDMGDLDGGIADYDEAIRFNPRLTDAFYNRGVACEAKGDLEGAIADYDEAIRLDPRLTDAFYNRGNARKAKGDLEGAIADYDEAIRLNSRYANAFNNRGLARKVKGDVDGAISDYDEAIRLNPRDANTFYNRGLARKANGDVDGAIADYEFGARLAPHDEKFRNRLDELRTQEDGALIGSDHEMPAPEQRTVSAERMLTEVARIFREKEGTNVEWRERLVSKLLDHEAGWSMFFVTPNIPDRKLRHATEATSFGNDEEILAVLDCTALGSAKNCVVFTPSAALSNYAGAHRKIRYEELGNSSIDSSGRYVEKDGSIILETTGSDPATRVASLLNDIGRAVGGEDS